MDLKSFFRGVWQKWKKVTDVIAYYNTKFLVGLLFFTVFMLYGVIIRLLKIDLIDIRISKDVKSYWKQRETKEKDYSKQY